MESVRESGLPKDCLNHLADLIRRHRDQRRSRWHRLDPGKQALLALAHLRNGDTYTRPAWGFEIGVSTAWRCVREAVDLLAATADDLDTAMETIRGLAYAILDGTLIPIDRVADQKPYYFGKHRRHGVNVQVIADAAGRLVWASAALPRFYSRPDRGPHPRHHPDAVQNATGTGRNCSADKGRQPRPRPHPGPR